MDASEKFPDREYISEAKIAELNERWIKIYARSIIHFHAKDSFMIQLTFERIPVVVPVLSTGVVLSEVTELFK